jgi:hypothetical protein
MARLLATAVGLFGLGMVLTAGCSGSSFTESGDGGSSATAGKTSNGGSTSQAGSSSGGTNDSSGSSSGGSGTAGSTNGGTGNGGTAAAGSNSGGTGTAGTGTGTAGSGGSTNVSECMQDSDCVQCQYAGTPTQTSDCCTNCKYTPMTKRACEEGRAVYDKFCANRHPLCPAIACIEPPVVQCKGSMCVAAK